MIEKDRVVETPVAKQPQPMVANPPPSFPHSLARQKEEATYKKFLDLLKHVHVNIPLVDILQGIPKLPTKLNDPESFTIEISIGKRVVVKDPKSFTIEISIGKQIVARALCDLGASINLMPSSIFRKLGLGMPRPTTMVLQLADRSLAKPEGIIKDVLVQVGSLIIPVDFVILDFEPDPKVPFILGHPFLATGRSLIDVAAGQLTMRVHDKVEIFNVYKALKMPAIYEGVGHSYE
ncbi:uncharacterized protein LOC132054264 [Lycium ferocissimum]|uniref:uncharacterized protein LOC132054264 n=1 Tax=Lycium ferocissimum TaxID=112874 RepID=UPI0028149CC6|nr:uncharacterized protein LOC132054264 [Lycium ferocissimum]